MIAHRGTHQTGGKAVAPHHPRSEPAELEEFSDDGDDIAFDVLSSPVGGGGGLGKLLKRLLGDAHSAGSGEPGADAAESLESGRPAGVRLGKGFAFPGICR